MPTMQEVTQRITELLPDAAATPPAIVWHAAQIATTWQLRIFEHEVRIIRHGKRPTSLDGDWEPNYIVIVGVRGLRRKAREQSPYMIRYTSLSDTDLQLARGELYHPDDVGIECQLYRLDLMQACARIAAPYIPTAARGYWRKYAEYDPELETWQPDHIPGAWGRVEVAQLRSEINALKLAYDLPLNVADPALTNDEVIETISHQLAKLEAEQAPPLTVELQREPDGDVLFA